MAEMFRLACVMTLIDIVSVNEPIGKTNYPWVNNSTA
ncbi:MAG: hypothetical protein ACJAT8_000142 [Cellvibrionaceae bacterium]|jgi:hypothetical protein